MRSIFAGIILVSASIASVDIAHGEKHSYAQALFSHRQPIQLSRDKIGVDPVHADEDALTRKIELDKTRLDRLIEICPSC
jgi:hypothetical protein